MTNNFGVFYIFAEKQYKMAKYKNSAVPKNICDSVLPCLYFFTAFFPFADPSSFLTWLYYRYT